MSKGIVYKTSYPDNPPEWYWTSGLHDAAILSVEELEFPFDYSEFAKSKENYKRSCLTLKIDASDALFDSSVKEIRFYNYKFISGNTTLNLKEKLWWMADRLTETDTGYSIDIDLYNCDSDPENFTLSLKFDSAEVERT